MVTLTVSKNNKPVGLLVTIEAVKGKVPLQLSEAASTTLTTQDGVSITGVSAIMRFLGRTATDLKLYGQTVLQQTEVDHWLDFAANKLGCAAEFKDAVLYLNTALSPVTFLVGQSISLADYAVFSSLRGSNAFAKQLSKKDVPQHVLRYYNLLLSLPEVKAVCDSLPPVESSAQKAKAESAPVKKERKEEGKFIELPGAKMGEVVVRFPPEASGYLHIGHAKAALLNQYYQTSFNGKLIMRFDDTNPAKENAEYEKVILEDIAMLGLKPDLFTHTSDSFDLIMDYCTKLIKEGKAYVDDTDGETMKKEREERIESRSRSLSVEENLSRWEEMKKGSESGLKCAVRAKIDMKSDNGCLRDPTIFRCKLEPHVRTGKKYKAYPTYDFACPIVDSVEGVTHALRTTEYHDRDDQYYWFIEALGLRKPYVWAYSRLNLQNTVMSKRKLTWFVQEGLVEGWEDPRFPTVRGVLRRGMTVEGLKEFVIAQGSSRSVNMMDWDKIWAFNKKVIDPVVPRYTALVKDSVVPVNVAGASTEVQQKDKHPKNASVGTKSVWYSGRVMVDREDADVMQVGENVTFVNWGNLKITNIVRDASGKVESVAAETNLGNTDYKKTMKITWLAETDQAPFIPALCVNFDHIITKGILSKDDDFKDYVNKNSRHETVMIGDPELKSLKKGDIIQLQRRGFFICDSPYEPASRHSGRESPCILLNIPDGHVKEMHKAGSKHKDAAGASAKEQAQSKKGKKAEKSPQEEVAPSVPSGGDAATLNVRITEQGGKVRKLKEQNAAKSEVDSEVKVLLALKSEFKKLTGKEWKPGQAPPAQAAEAPAAGNAASLSDKINAQGDKIRELKAKKISKADLEPEIKVLLSLKEEYKAVTGQDWKPGSTPSQKPDKSSQQKMPVESAVAGGVVGSDSKEATDLKAKIDAQGSKVRELKSASPSDKGAVDAAVKELLSLKERYKKLTGEDLAGAGRDKKAKKGGAKQQAPPSAKSQSSGGGDTREVKKVTRLGLEVKKEENLPEWYSQVITKGELIEYYDVSGCYVFRPWSFAIWEAISKWFDGKIKEIGFENCYFPMFVSNSALEKEKEHIEDFAPEVAWVTKSGQSELAEPIAIRPTSETVMYPSYSKWVQSHRDLPIKLNQWCSVVRWEFKHPQPFLRTREFLWQEGHSAYATYAEAEKEVYHIIDLYEEIYETLLAIPVIKGRKTQKEKFAGGDFTTTVEAYIAASGRGIQAATSHHLGQNFSKMFDISFEDPESNSRGYAYQNSWAITTRSIGVIVMTHGDNKGLVLPPRIASVQCVVVPCGITAQLKDEDKKNLISECEKLSKALRAGGVKVKEDYRDHYSPGWKFNHWELKGVPVRIELGPNDIKKGQFVAVRRDTGEKMTFDLSGALTSVKELLEQIHESMFNKVKKEMDEHLDTCYTFDDFCSSLDKKNIILAPFCGDIPCEDKIKKLSARDAVVEEGAPAMGAKGLCIPFKQPAEIKDSDKCICGDCPNKPKYYTLFGRSY